MQKAAKIHSSRKIFNSIYSYIGQIFKFHKLLLSLFGFSKSYHKSYLIPTNKIITFSPKSKVKRNIIKTTYIAKKEEASKVKLNDIINKINGSAFKRGLAIHVLNEIQKGYDHGFKIKDDKETKLSINALQESANRVTTDFDDEIEHAKTWYKINDYFKTKNGFGHAAQKLITELAKSLKNEAGSASSELTESNDNPNVEDINLINGSESSQTNNSENNTQMNNQYALIRNKIACLLTDLINVRYNHSKNMGNNESVLLYPLHNIHDSQLTSNNSVFSLKNNGKTSGGHFRYDADESKYRCITSEVDSTTIERIVTSDELHDYTFMKPVAYELKTKNKQSSKTKTNTTSTSEKNFNYVLTAYNIDFSQRLTIIVLNTMLEVLAVAQEKSKEEITDENKLERFKQLCDESIYSLPGLLIDTIQSQTTYKENLVKADLDQNDKRLAQIKLLDNIDKISQLVTNALDLIQINYAKDDTYEDNYHKTSQSATLIGFCSDTISLDDRSFDTGTPNTSPIKRKL